MSQMARDSRTAGPSGDAPCGGRAARKRIQPGSALLGTVVSLVLTTLACATRGPSAESLAQTMVAGTAAAASPTLADTPTPPPTKTALPPTETTTPSPSPSPTKTPPPGPNRFQ